MNPLPPVALDDLSHILTHGETDWASLRGERLFITGGTGFFGTWLLEAVVAANRQLGTKIEIWILSRNPVSFAKRSPHLANAPGVHWLTGDVTDFVFPDGTFSHIVHAATTTNAQLNEAHPQVMLDTIVRGTERLLEFAERSATQRLLLTSSGAVYGPQASEMLAIPETCSATADIPSTRSMYAEGKRLSESLCSHLAEQSGIEVKIARCFAFVGPHLPLDAHFAIGNFIGNFLKQQTIQVRGDGTPLRSYLYAADLVIWLIRILVCGKSCYPYNVGSEKAISIADLAYRIATTSTIPLSVKCQLVTKSGQTPQAYIPDISRARHELGLSDRISLEDGINRTIAWHKDIR